ncbi:MAG: hypothetical protein AAF934_00305 [Bacteroidota bacterium]
MKTLLQITTILTATLTIVFTTSMALDIVWIQAHTARVVLVHLVMGLELYLGYMTLKELIKKQQEG